MHNREIKSLWRKVQGHALISVAAIFLCSTGLYALEGTAFFNVNSVDVYQEHGIDGLWKVDIATGKRIQLFGNNDGSAIVDFALLSYDGRRVFFTLGGRSFIIDNDGDNLSRQDNITMALEGVANTTAAAWGQQGIYYGDNVYNGPSNVYRYDPENARESLVLSSEGKAKHAGTCGMFCSVTGEIVWGRINMPPSCGTDSYAYSYMHFSRTGRLLKMFAWRDWGHGEEMGLGGRRMYHQIFWRHDGFWVRQTSDGQTVKGYVLRHFLDSTTEYGGAYERKCTNHPDYFGLEMYNKAKSTYTVYNLTTDELEGNIPNPVNEDSSLVNPRPKLAGLWLGNDLPAPGETRAYIVALDNPVGFHIAGETGPVHKTIEILNIGWGDMTKVSVNASPSAGWLSTAVNGLHGNKQYVILEVNPSDVPSDGAQTTLTISSGSARNSVNVPVTVNKQQLAAPSFFKVSKVAGDESKAQFTWIDNSDGEDGFVIDYCSETWEGYRRTGSCFGHAGEYGNELVRVGAGVTSFVGTGLTYTDHHSNHYRIRAISDTYGSSEPSNGSMFLSSHSTTTVDFLLADGWVSLVRPRQGFIYAAGQDMTISWVSDDIANIKLEYSDDDAANWHTIASKIPAGAALHQSHVWPVPASLDGKDVIVRAIDADDPDIRSIRIAYVRDVRFGDGAVAVNDTFPAIGLNPFLPSESHEDLSTGVYRGASGQLSIVVSHPGQHNFQIFSLKGAVIASGQGRGPHTYSLNISDFGTSVYIARIVTKKESVEKKFTVFERY